MDIDFDRIGGADIYAWMSNLIAPRPIAWVSSSSGSGVANLAPYSYFNAVGTRPPTLMFCPANHSDGREKDTLVNVRRSGQFVVNLVTPEVASAMNATAADVDAEVSEFELAGIDRVHSSTVDVPRVADAVAAFECGLHSVVTLAAGPGGANLVIGRIRSVYVADDFVDDVDGRPLPNAESLHNRFHPIGRMGGPNYARTADQFEIDRPS